MRKSIDILGDYVLDGRNRARAADELSLQRVPLRQLPDDTDAVAYVASINIHRRHLTATQRTRAAANLLKLSHRAFLDNNPDEPDPDTLPPLYDDEALGQAEPSAPAPSRNGRPSQEARAARPARQSEPAPRDPVETEPADDAGGDVEDDEVPPASASVESEPAASVPEEGDPPPADIPEDAKPLADLTDGVSPVLSTRKVAAAYDVGRSRIVVAQRLGETHPDLGPPMDEAVITLNDAERIQFEPPDVRAQAVQDVRDGKATTAVRAIRARYNREPAPDPSARLTASDRQPPPVDAPAPGELGVSPKVIGLVREVLGTITLDPCSARWCAERVDAVAWFGAEDDALSREWHGRVWVFPPPEAADPFLLKTLLELDHGHIEAAVLLVPMAPWSDATADVFRSSHFRAVVVPGTPVSLPPPGRDHPVSRRSVVAAAARRHRRAAARHLLGLRLGRPGAPAFGVIRHREALFAMRPFVPSLVGRPLMGIAGLLALLFMFRFTAPGPATIDFEPAVAGDDAVAGEPVSLTEWLVPVHNLALCVETLARRITVESSASFELFDHAYRDECRCRSQIAADPQWRLAADWFGPAFMNAVYGILDSERDLVVRAVADDRALGRPVRAAALWRSALGSMAVRLREFTRLIVLAYSSASAAPDASLSLGSPPRPVV